MAKITRVLATGPGLSFSFQFNDVTNVITSLNVINSSLNPGTIRFFHPLTGEVLISIPSGTNQTVDLAGRGIIVALVPDSEGDLALPEGMEIGWQF